MARRDALLRLHKTLLARRGELLRKLTEDLDNLRNLKDSDTRDSLDVAFESNNEEMASQLAEFDARELEQIDRALARLKQGTYGQCEACSTKIPVGRLNALPYCTHCIECQREMERYPGGWADNHGHRSWEKVYDSSMEEPRDVRLSDLEIDLPK